MKHGLFITFEGPDGSGKSTHAEKLKQWFKNKGFSVILTREPGGTRLAESIRKLLLNSENSVSPITELLLYAASRAQHTQELILPSLKQGKIIISDRYYDSTVAYQHYGRGLDLKTIKELNTIASGGLTPDLTILIDLETKKSLGRLKNTRKKDRIENENTAFHRKIRNGYLALAKNEPRRIKIVKSNNEMSATFESILSVVKDFIKKQ
ncbi:MAG: dTMP kinase [Elusimicrobia bacterium RIFOXYA2_FULL_39_19]|nr:MAG: dTMP kinase [Elusimicrobia bacterium RIFOXYA2_FULL_39_19]